MAVHFSSVLVVLVCSMAFPGQHKSLILAKFPHCCAVRPAQIPHCCLYKPVTFLSFPPSSPDFGISLLHIPLLVFIPYKHYLSGHSIVLAPSIL